MFKDLAYEDDTVSIFLEYHPYYGVLMHCDVHKWSKGVAKHFWGVWENLLEELSDNGYEEIYALVGDNKLRRFASLYGFESTSVFLFAEGKNREVMKCLI